MKVGAGIVIYRLGDANVREYLILKASKDPYHWSPPKGHINKGESDLLATAFRETIEETGISKDDLEMEAFQIKSSYLAKGKPKEVTYWLARLKTNSNVKLSHEHTEFIWSDFNKTLELVSYESLQKVIKACDEYLEKLDK